MWQQASLPAVEPGFPARRTKPRAKQTVMDYFGRHARFGRLFRAAGCRPLRQAGKPAATLLDGADAPEIVRGGVRRVREHQRPERTGGWRRASLPAVEPGFPARRTKPRANQMVMDCFGRHARFGRLFRAAGCRPPRQAGKPAATLLDGADAPEIVCGGVRRVGEHQRPE